jgi:hypothetical protein
MADVRDEAVGEAALESVPAVSPVPDTASEVPWPLCELRFLPLLNISRIVLEVWFCSRAATRVRSEVKQDSGSRFG